MEGGYSINRLPGRINWIFSLHFSVLVFKNMQLQLQLLCTKLRRFSRAALMLNYVVVEISVSARQLEAAFCFFRKLQILFFSSVEQYLFCFVLFSSPSAVESKRKNVFREVRRNGCFVRDVLQGSGLQQTDALFN